MLSRLFDFVMVGLLIVTTLGRWWLGQGLGECVQACVHASVCMLDRHCVALKHRLQQRLVSNVDHLQADQLY
jgi:hypothetical protein